MQTFCQLHRNWPPPWSLTTVSTEDDHRTAYALRSLRTLSHLLVFLIARHWSLASAYIFLTGKSYQGDFSLSSVAL